MVGRPRRGARRLPRQRRQPPRAAGRLPRRQNAPGAERGVPGDRRAPSERADASRLLPRGGHPLAGQPGKTRVLQLLDHASDAKRRPDCLAPASAPVEAAGGRQGPARGGSLLLSPRALPERPVRLGPGCLRRADRHGARRRGREQRTHSGAGSGRPAAGRPLRGALLGRRAGLSARARVCGGVPAAAAEGKAGGRRRTAAVLPDPRSCRGAGHLHDRTGRADYVFLLPARTAPANGDASDLEAELPVAAPLGKRPPAGEGGPLPRKRPRGAIARGRQTAPGTDNKADHKNWHGVTQCYLGARARAAGAAVGPCWRRRGCAGARGPGRAAARARWLRRARWQRWARTRACWQPPPAQLRPRRAPRRAGRSRRCARPRPRSPSGAPSRAQRGAGSRRHAGSCRRPRRAPRSWSGARRPRSRRRARARRSPRPPASTCSAARPCTARTLRPRPAAAGRTFGARCWR
ncbi:DNA polymerase processivity factor [Caprine alphaherpesvirus 1]|uniref:DNA polymerase processivity factor n=1 Tax=Caprine alphaherpesvirus 1 TaxID=39944 RepID=A0AAE6D0H7_9ALPH|nr:DNA polymerase processivity factor [Caprine alphaherpesvirus 1]QBM10858.1 DNA polymerase processivity factor [Caprine alphaherpesvirus 1]